MRKALILFLICPKLFAVLSTGSSLSIAPISVYVQQPMGASLTVYNYSTGSSLIVLDIIPRGWYTPAGASTTIPVSWDKPAVGPGQPTTIGPLGSVIYRYSGVFHSPSVSPAYAGGPVPASSSSSLLQVGTQTFSVNALVRTNNGETNASDTKTVTVFPLALPESQR